MNATGVADKTANGFPTLFLLSCVPRYYFCTSTP
jgi:hypothetical protein